MAFFDKNADFIALLHYRTTEEGGRRTPVASGYRPQVKFDFEKIMTSGQQTFINQEVVFPGDMVEAEIHLLYTDCFENKLTEGMEFDFKEGSVVIGQGKITQVRNEKLRKI